ncbi:fgf-1 [Trichoplusia ni granulovirus LBIV-12]|uniref:Fgf-1 n=1 Tax=Trichoplusia ni granulovirus LBIV-12 TaxID=1916701 RepID=A0A1D8QLB8_GVTN|nr:fgf-1 [Trichoplusia ni granulovirus LBIV-12]AOW41418.1 fgf-1 [Trichoplusia ni granulovirus LBIV-12]
MPCLIYTTLMVAAAIGLTESTKLYSLNNVFYDMYFCTSETDLTITRTSAGIPTCPITKFNIQPYNNGLVLMFKQKAKCKHMCMDSCGKMYITEKYVPEECTWTTVAFKDIDTLSQNRGNYTQFLAFYSYYTFEFYASSNFYLHSYYQNLHLHIKEVSVTNKDEVCVLNPKTVGVKANCVNRVQRSDSVIDMHKNYNSITLFDKLLAFLGFYEIKPPKPETTLRYIDYNSNFPK